MKFKFLSLLLTGIFAVGIPTNVLAASDNPTENMIKVTDQVVEEIALNWAKAQGINVSLTVDNIVRIYDTDDQPVGYSVGYFNGDIPYGYAIIDFEAPGFISEYNFEEQVPDMYTSILSEQSISRNSLEENSLYELYPTEYYVEYSDFNEIKYANNYGDIINSDEFELYDEQVKSYYEENPITIDSDSTRSPYYTDSDIFINSIPSSYFISESGRFNSFYCCDESSSEYLTKRYACGVNALAGNARLVESDLYHQDFVSAYNKLWNLAGASVYKIENGIEYALTYTRNMGPAFLSYLRDEGIEATYVNIDNPSYSQFKAVVNGRNPNVLCYGINLKDENGNISRSGHVIVTEGYSLASLNGNYYYYLYIADGWKTYGRYLNLSTSFTDITLVKFDGVTVTYGY